MFTFAKRGVFVLIGAGLCLAVESPATGQTKLMASDGAAYDLFGTSVSIYGNRVLVGANSDDDVAINTGSVYVYTTQDGVTWEQEAKLTASDARQLDQFGMSVALVGDVAIVGAPSDDDDAMSNEGSVYVFRRVGDSWIQETKLHGSASHKRNQFGFDVAYAGGTLLIGAPLEYGGADQSGAAYVFTHNGIAWVEEARLVAPDPDVMASFGFDVALSSDGGTAIIGAHMHDGSTGVNQGASYVFVRDNGLWVQQAKLTPGDIAEDDRFGFPVALQGDTAFVGSHMDDDLGYNSGSVYVYERVGEEWVESQKIVASDGGLAGFFGRTIAVRGDALLIGALSDSGSAYVFRKTINGWVEKAKLVSFDRTFGYSMAVWGNTIVAGANRGGGSSSEGSAYVMTIESCMMDIVREGVVHGAIVNGSDLGILVSNWGKPGMTDLNGDGVTDGDDLGRLLYGWGICPD
ncbi:MAG: FG-GAP repeat protein [Phycisphaerales bacterium JB043]